MVQTNHLAQNLIKEPLRRKFYFVLLLFVGAMLAMVALFIPLMGNPVTPNPSQGQVAPRDFRASKGITFESQVLTEQWRQAAESEVASIYTLPDTRLARQQLDRLRGVLAYISNVRADPYASLEQKLADLSAIEDIPLNQETGAAILKLADARWQETQQETIAVLEKAMSGTIQPEDIVSVHSRLPSLVSLSLSEDQATIVVRLAAAFVIPNSHYSEELTQASRQAARQAVKPITRTFVPGQTIALQGTVLSAADIEALQQLGLFEPQRKWQDWASAATVALLLVAFLLFYLRLERASLARDLRSMALIAILFLGVLLVARLIIPGHTVIPYAFPVATFALTIAAIFGAQVALVTTMPLSVLVAYGMPSALELTVYYLVGSLFGVLAIGRARRIITFFWAGAAIAIAGFIVVLIYRLPQPENDVIGLATLGGGALLNGLASAGISVLLQFVLGQLLGLVTPLQLVELTRPDHPLMQRLLREAPGTYQHSLQVANLAEQAAEKIGADPLLTRAGALYHDIGKTNAPALFIENQLPGFFNPHETLSPVESAQEIIKHVPDGLELGRKHHLPRRILDFISEHHGTLITRYQFARAVEAAEGNESKVDREIFRYPGQRPQSREVAILMLADGCEARVRGEHPANEEEMRRLIKEVFQNRMSQGQLDDTRLTLRDLNIIAESFATNLRGIYHPRIQYPKFEAEASRDVPTGPLPAKPPARLSSPPDTPADQPVNSVNSPGSSQP
jgi:putative nucleotidyltransferase with HDIG domain